MAKDTFYFSHDYNARHDPKMQDLLMGLGCEGIGIYWCIVEQLYEQDGTLPLAAVKSIAFTLHIEPKKVESVLNDYGLFKQDDNEFWSESVRDRIQKRSDLVERRRLAAEARWNKEKDKQQQDATGCTCIDLQMQNNSLHMDCNAIKGKESKGKDIKEEDKNTIGDKPPKPSKPKKPEFDLSFVEPQFKDCFTEWLEYKRGRKQSYKTQESLQKCYNTLVKYANGNKETAAEIIDSSIANNYSGFFEPKQKPQTYKHPFSEQVNNKHHENF